MTSAYKYEYYLRTTIESEGKKRHMYLSQVFPSGLTAEFGGIAFAKLFTSQERRLFIDMYPYIKGFWVHAESEKRRIKKATKE